jgi:uncharacterized coiled-coil protein SlyX
VSEPGVSMDRKQCIVVEASSIPLPVCIAGMHRSGTSMVAKLLHEAGLHLGEPADLMPPAEENPEGFFEHLGFVRLNDELLNTAGGGWDCPPAADFDWESPALDPFRERARLLAAPLQTSGRWGWKDPRNSLTIPFWRSVLGPLRTVVVVRNPLEVVTSLHRRNGFSIALGLTLWQIYAERVLRDTAPNERIVTHFDAFFLTPEREFARLIEALGLPGATGDDAAEAAAVPSLRHHRKSLRDLEEHGFSPAVIELYLRLCQEAGWWEGDAAPRIPGTPSVTNAADSPLARGLGKVDLLRVENEALRRNNADFTAALAGREARIAELEIALDAHEAARAELEGKVAERDSKVAERNALLQQQQRTIAALRDQLAETEAGAAQLRDDAAVLAGRVAERERELEIAAIHERELRAMLTASQEIHVRRDTELMGTLGAVLSRHAPGAPASIYHRRLVGQVRAAVANHVPAGARLLVATYGDDALLSHGDRRSQPFPQSPSGVTADYTDVNSAEAIAQLEALRDDGAEYLVVPSPALPWLASHPELERHLDERYDAVFRERGVATVYALARRQGRIPA